MPADLYTWYPGQSVAIDRKVVATVERVTPSGRAIVNERTFRQDGRQIGDYYSNAKLEPLTPEIEAEMELAKCADCAKHALYKATDALGRFERESFGVFRDGPQELLKVQMAERMAAAINLILKEGKDGQVPPAAQESKP